MLEFNSRQEKRKSFYWFWGFFSLVSCGNESDKSEKHSDFIFSIAIFTGKKKSERFIRKEAKQKKSFCELKFCARKFCLIKCFRKAKNFCANWKKEEWKKSERWRKMIEMNLKELKHKSLNKSLFSFLNISSYIKSIPLWVFFVNHSKTSDEFLFR